MLSLLNGKTRLTAVFAMNDVMAFGATQAIRDRGLQVPDDIAVVGFDDIRLAGIAGGRTQTEVSRPPECRFPSQFVYPNLIRS